MKSGPDFFLNFTILYGDPDITSDIYELFTTYNDCMPAIFKISSDHLNTTGQYEGVNLNVNGSNLTIASRNKEESVTFFVTVYHPNQPLFGNLVVLVNYKLHPCATQKLNITNEPEYTDWI